MPKASALVADEIRGRIARRELPAGSPLPNEGELMECFHVARATAREALRVLEAEGLVEIARGARGGARVKEPEIASASGPFALLLQMRGATIADVYAVRLLLEPAAARLVAERAPRRAARELEAVIEEEERMVEGETSLAEPAIRFQTRLVELAGNPALELLVRLVHDLVARQAVAPISLALEPGARRRLRRRLIRAQRRLTAAIHEGRGADAERLWRRYLAGLAARLLGDVRSGRPVTRHAPALPQPASSDEGLPARRA